MAGRLQDKVALVAGAGSIGPGWGNGRAIAVRFAEEGAMVFAVDKSADAMAETLDRVHAFGGEIRSHVSDVTDSAAVAGMVAACLAAYGRIDVLVNNVGRSAAGGPVELSKAATVVSGQLHTPMVEARLAGQRMGGDVERLLESRVARIPAGSMGDGRDTANAALFLASDEARFVTGTEIIVNGGMVARCD